MNRLRSVNPSTGEEINARQTWQARALDAAVVQTSAGASLWAGTPMPARCSL